MIYPPATAWHNISLDEVILLPAKTKLNWIIVHYECSLAQSAACHTGLYLLFVTLGFLLPLSAAEPYTVREARIHVRHIRDLLKSLDPSDAYNGVDCNSLSFLSIFTDGDLGGMTP